MTQYIDKCIISNIDCELPTLLNKAIYIVDNDESYFKLIDKSLDNSLVFDKQTVTEFLNTIDYSKLLNSIFTALEHQVPPLK